MCVITALVASLPLSWAVIDEPNPDPSVSGVQGYIGGWGSRLDEPNLGLRS